MRTTKYSIHDHNLFGWRFIRIVLAAVLLTTLMVMLFARGSSAQSPATTINWGTIGWDDTNVTTTEINTYFDEANHNENPYHGLSSATGGVANFLSQTFTDVNGSGVDVTVYFSQNMDDQSPGDLDVPTLYGPTGGGGPNPDCRVTGEWTFRSTRDATANTPHATYGMVRTPFTVVLSFSEPIYMNELIVGSLSFIVGAGAVPDGYEHGVVRAFSSDDATGAVVKASAFNNISNLADDSTLLHNTGVDCGLPATINELGNVAMDPDYTYVGGVGQGIGDPADDGIYHAIGVGSQDDDRYGRVLLSYEDTPVQSIAFSTWTTAGVSFTEDFYLDAFHSVTFAPFTFTPASAPATATPVPTAAPATPAPVTPVPSDPDSPTQATRSGSANPSNPALPAVGFAPGRVSELPAQPSDFAYREFDDLWVEIPKLGVKAPIWGVPKTDQGWDTTWLWQQVGYLDGTAFPTWQGNSVLAGHVYLPDGQPGPFVGINSLDWGDQIIVHAWGQDHIYEVRSVQVVRPNNRTVLQSPDDYHWLTLLTCKDYDEAADSYHARTAVQAVLVDVSP